jgi:hypothetical protein
MFGKQINACQYNKWSLRKMANKPQKILLTLILMILTLSVAILVITPKATSEEVTDNLTEKG